MKNKPYYKYYADQLIERKEQLQEVSNTIAVDAFFALEPFITPMVEAGFTVITRLRKNAVMRYLYNGPRTGRRGRPKQYEGRVDPIQLNMNHFTECDRCQNGEWIAYEAVVNVRSWKRSVKLVVQHFLASDGSIKAYKIFACTDTNILGKQTKKIYGCRFQIEFLYRDAKQELGLEHCQARSPEKFHFHINTSLTCGSLAKAAYYLPQQQEDRKAFSIADIKNANANDFLLDKLILWFGFKPELKIIKSVRSKVRALGKRAA